MIGSLGESGAKTTAVASVTSRRASMDSRLQGVRVHLRTRLQIKKFCGHPALSRHIVTDRFVSKTTRTGYFDDGGERSAGRAIRGATQPSAWRRVPHAG